MSTLTHYTDWACIQNTKDLEFALKDIQECLRGNEDWTPDHSYGSKLWNEFDAIVVELYNRKKEFTL